MIVEDNPQDLELTIRSLRESKLTLRVFVARDGAEALNYIFDDDGNPPAPRRELPKFILLDLQLPKVSGLQVLERLKRDARTQRIPVVILSSSKEPGDLARGYELGVNSYIVKPVSYEGYRQVVGALGRYWMAINQHGG